MPNNAGERVYAGFFVRLAAYLIDWIIVGTALLVIRIPVWIASLGGADLVLKDFIFSYSLYDIVLYALKVTYFVLLTYYTGATLGKKLLHIRVISSEDRKPTFFEILFRESVGKFLSGLILEIGYLMIGLEKNKCGLHDILSDTYVVYQHQKVVAVPTPVIYRQAAYNVPASQMPPYGGNGTIPPQDSTKMPPYGSNGAISPQNPNQMPPYAGNETMPPQNQSQMPPYANNETMSAQDRHQTPSYTDNGTMSLQTPNQMPSYADNETVSVQPPNQILSTGEIVSSQNPNKVPSTEENTTF